jgi:shikimate kinase
MQIIIIGFMGVGKTTLGKLLADRLDRPVTDLDNLLENVAGEKVGAYFDRVGEVQFRKLESALLKRTMLVRTPIISTGGGVIESDENVELLMASDATVVWLTSSFENNLVRLKQDSQDRPLFKGNSETELRRLWQRRNEEYQSIADMVIDTDDLNPEQVLEKVITQLF